MSNSIFEINKILKNLLNLVSEKPLGFRKVSNKSGFRALGEEEIIQRGDERQLKFNPGWESADNVHGHVVNSWPLYEFRRPIETEPSLLTQFQFYIDSSIDPGTIKFVDVTTKEICQIENILTPEGSANQQSKVDDVKDSLAQEKINLRFMYHQHSALSRKLDDANSLIAKLLPSYKPVDEATVDGLYRILEKGEITIDGDEILHEKWRVFTGPCMRITRAPVIFRRLIYAEKNNEYYYLKPNDVIKEGDDSANINSSDWQPVTAYSVGKTADHDFDIKFRRLNIDRDLSTEATADSDISELSRIKELEDLLRKARADSGFDRALARALRNRCDVCSDRIKELEKVIATMREQNEIGDENDLLKKNVCDEESAPKLKVHGYTLPTSRGNYTYAWTIKPEPAAEKTVIDPGKGYRWLEADETLEEGDELQTDTWEWVVTHSVGQTIKAVQKEAADNRTYRRKVRLWGTGWRLLDAGETIQRGDKCVDACEARKRNIPCSAWVGHDLAGQLVPAASTLLFARNIKPEVPKATPNPFASYPGDGYYYLKLEDKIQPGDWRRLLNCKGQIQWSIAKYPVGTLRWLWHDREFRRSIIEPEKSTLTLDDFNKAAENAIGYTKF